jgi:hypothetical protein
MRGSAVRLERRSHNPQVGGSNPSPATNRRHFGRSRHTARAVPQDRRVRLVTMSAKSSEAQSPQTFRSSSRSNSNLCSI